LATISLGLADIKLTRPFEKYDWPRARTASLKFRATFWAIPIIYSQFGRTLESDVGGPLLLTRVPLAFSILSDCGGRWSIAACELLVAGKERTGNGLCSRHATPSASRDSTSAYL
jgi:hypothetical protein